MKLTTDFTDFLCDTSHELVPVSRQVPVDNRYHDIHSYLFTRYKKKPTGCTIYFQFISIINLYMLRAGLLLIIRKYYSVYTSIGICRAENNGTV